MSDDNSKEFKDDDLITIFYFLKFSPNEKYPDTRTRKEHIDLLNEQIKDAELRLEKHVKDPIKDRWREMFISGCERVIKQNNYAISVIKELESDIEIMAKKDG